MGDEEEFYDETQVRIEIHKLIDRFVDKFASRMRNRIAQHMTEEHNVVDPAELHEHMLNFVDDESIATAKHIVKALIPAESPVTILLVSYAMLGTLTSHAIHNAMQNLANDPEAMADMVRSLRESDEAEDIMEHITHQHRRKAQRYRDVDIHGSTMKIADLGDVVSNINLN